MRRKNATAVAAIVFLGLAVYANSLRNGFLYDDEGIIIENAMIKNWRNVPSLISGRYFALSGENSYRPLVTFSYGIDYFLWGLNPFGFHLTNIALHIGSALLLYFLVLRGSGLSPAWKEALRNAGKSKTDSWSPGCTLPLLVSLLFICHPVQSEAVNAVAYREDLLCALFYFACLVFYLRSRGQSRRPISPFSVMFFIAALLSKEMACSLPLILILVDKVQGRTSDRRRHLVYWAVLTAYLFVYFVWMRNPGAVRVPYWGNSLYRNLLTTIRIIPAYLKLLLIPLDLCAEYTILPPSSLTETFSLFPFITSIGLLLGTIVWYRYCRPLYFCGAWLLITLVPVANVIPLRNPMAERYLYLPSVGYYLFLALIVVKAMGVHAAQVRNTAASLFVALVCAYSLTTMKRNLDWKDSLTFYRKTLMQVPGSGRFHNNLGFSYDQRGLYDQAADEYAKALSLSPGYELAHNNLGIIYGKKGLLEKAIIQFQKAIQVDPNFAKARNNLGMAYMLQGLDEKALAEFEEAVRIKPDFDKAYNNMGLLYRKHDLGDAAIVQFRKALSLNPDLPEARANLGISFFQRGEYEKSLEECREALRIEPAYAEAAYWSGKAFEALGNNEDAAQAYRRAVALDQGSPVYQADLERLILILALREENGKTTAVRREGREETVDPSDATMHNERGVLYWKSADFTKAIVEFNKALECNPQLAIAYFNLGVNHEALGDKEEAMRLYRKALEVDPGLRLARDKLGEQ